MRRVESDPRRIRPLRQLGTVDRPYGSWTRLNRSLERRHHWLFCKHTGVRHGCTPHARTKGMAQASRHADRRDESICGGGFSRRPAFSIRSAEQARRARRRRAAAVRGRCGDARGGDEGRGHRCRDHGQAGRHPRRVEDCPPGIRQDHDQLGWTASRQHDRTG